MAIDLIAEPRTELGKEAMKKLRAEGKLPGNLYGGPLKEPRTVQFEMHETEKAVKKNGKSAEYTVTFEGTTYPVRIEEVHYHPVRKDFQHLDCVVIADG